MVPLVTCARSTRIIHFRKETIELRAAASIYSEQRHRSPHHLTISNLLSLIISGASSLAISRKFSCKSSVLSSNSAIMASSSSSPAKAALLVMLLLSAVVASHGTKVACKNATPAPIKCNGVDIAVGAIVDVDVVVDVDLVLEVVDKAGNVVKGACKVPVDVTALVFVYVNASIQVKVAAVLGGLIGLVHTLLGLVLTVVHCVL